MLESIRGVFRGPFRTKGYHANTIENHLELIEEEERQASTNPMFMMKSLCWGMTWATKDQFASVKCPCLLIGGQSDGLIPPEELSVLNELIPDSRLHIIEQSAHFPMLEKPHQVVPLLSAFLEE